MENKHIVIITNLFPNKQEPTKGMFIKQFADRLSKKSIVTVVSPIPWVPKWVKKMTGKGVLLHKVVNLKNMTLYHPKYLVIPKIARFLYGWFYFLGIFKTIKIIHKNKPIDIISTHWVYPDGFGSVITAKILKIPVVVHARGCDINEYTKFFLRRILIRWALNNSTQNICVSSEIKNRINDLGIESSKTQVILNGVDQNKFSPKDKTLSRQFLGLQEEETYLVYVGNFQIEKGITYLIDAVAKVPDLSFKLLLVGSGPLQAKLEKQITKSRIKDKVVFIGRVKHHVIPFYLSACDLLCLPSLREGCPNIILESLSSSTPVLASNVGAVPDIVTKPEWGIIVPPCNSDSLANGIRTGIHLKNRQFPAFEWYDWDFYTDLVIKEYRKILE